jgi:hypothetical protein
MVRTPLPLPGKAHRAASAEESDEAPDRHAPAPPSPPGVVIENEAGQATVVVHRRSPNNGGGHSLKQPE